MIGSHEMQLGLLPLKQAVPAKEMEKMWTTNDPYLRVAQTVNPIFAWFPHRPTEASHATKTAR
jgi:hypothetical protein